MPTIQLDVAWLYHQVKIAKGFAKHGSPEWYRLDLMQAKLEGLSAFIGPWPDPSIAQAAKEDALRSILPEHRKRNRYVPD